MVIFCTTFGIILHSIWSRGQGSTKCRLINSKFGTRRYRRLDSVSPDAVAARRTSSSVRPLRLHVWRRSGGSRRSHQSSRRRTTWRELTSYFLLRPRGASLLAQTGRSEQGDVRSQSRWPRLDPPPPPFHRTHGLRRTTCGMAAASRGSHDRGRVKLSRTASKPA